ELFGRDGRMKQALKAIETGWRHLPHPDLAAAYAALHNGVAALPRVKQFERLASFNPSHPESHIAIAAAALEAQLWGEARRHLEAAGAVNGERPSARICRMMAELEEAASHDGAAARRWLERSAEAPPDPVYQCSACAAEHRSWQAICPNC